MPDGKTLNSNKGKDPLVYLISQYSTAKIILLPIPVSRWYKLAGGNISYTV